MGEMIWQGVLFGGVADADAEDFDEARHDRRPTDWARVKCGIFLKSGYLSEILLLTCMYSVGAFGL